MFLAPSAFQLRSKIGPKFVLEAVWGLLGGLLGPSWPQEGPKSQQDPQTLDPQTLDPQPGSHMTGWNQNSN